MAQKKTGSNQPKQRATTNVASATPKALSSPAMPSIRLLAALLAVVAFMLYTNTFNHSYVLDDVMVAPSNNMVQKGFSGIPELLTTPYLQGYIKMPNDNYRPLSPVTLAIETQFMGINPGFSHVVNVLLFVACVCILFLFLLAVMGKGSLLLAFTSTLLFAVHPIHSEVVANIKSRDELLCFLFAMLSLVLFIRFFSKGGIIWLCGGVLAYFLSLLSKETSISWLLIVPVLFFLFMDGDKKRAIVISVSVVMVGAVFLFIRHTVLENNHATDTSYLHFMDNQLVAVKDFSTRYGTPTLVLGHYLKLLLLPNPLICSYAYNTIINVGFGNIWVIISLLCYLGLATLAIYRLFKFKNDLLAFGILFLIINLGLFSNYFLLIGSVMSERFLFFASVGFCLAVAVMATKLIAVMAKQEQSTGFWVNKVWVALLPLALVYSVLTYSRNADWKDNMTLFTADVTKAPQNARLNYYLGNEMSTNLANSATGQMKAQIITESIPYLQKAVSINPEYAEAQTTLATAFFNLQQFDSAEVHHLKALSYDSLNALALNGLAGIYFMKQNFPKARDILIRDVAINPRNTSVVHNLGLCYLNMRIYDSCIYYGRKVLAIDASHHETFKDMARAYYLLQQPDSANKYIALAQAKEPSFKLP